MTIPVTAYNALFIIQSVIVLGGLVFFIYDRLKITGDHSNQIKDLDKSIKDLTNQVSTLASSISNLQGQMEVFREMVHK